MVCPECGCSRVPFWSIGVHLRRIAEKLNALSRRGADKAERRSEDIAPSLTELVTLVERDVEITIFG